MNFHSAIILCIRLFIAQQNRSIGVNVVSKGSPSRTRRVLRISLGITILPKSSTLLTMPVAFIIYLSPFTILYGTTKTHVIPRPVRRLVVGIPSLTRRWPRRCAPRNDSGYRQPPTIILQITLLVSVN